MSLFKKITGCNFPVIQAPMAGVSTVKLASAVTNAGGIGSIPLGSIDYTSVKGMEQTRSLLGEFDKLTEGSRLVNLNFFAHEPQVAPTGEQLENWRNLFSKYNPDVKAPLVNSNISIKEIERNHPQQFSQLWKEIKDFRPKIVSFHFGYPSLESIQQLKSSGILVLVTATSPEEAIEVSGFADGIVLQGYEAGGHRGTWLSPKAELDEGLSTLVLVQQVQSLLESKPFLIATGGIVDNQTVKLYLEQLGVDAVQCGTAFIPSAECGLSASNEWLCNSISLRENLGTVMTDMILGKRARALRTKFIVDVIERHDSAKSLPDYGYRYKLYKDFLGATAQLIPDFGFFLVGQNYKLLTDRLNAKERLELLMSIEK